MSSQYLTFNDNDRMYTAVDDPFKKMKETYVFKEEYDSQVCSLVSSVKLLEHERRVEKRRRWRNAMKLRRR